MPRPRRPDGVLSPRIAQLMALADGTRTGCEVAAAMGYTRGGQAAAISTARMQGAVPQFRRPSRPAGQASPRQMVRLMDLADGTRTRPEIATALGMNIKALSVVMSEARKRGLDPRFAPLPQGGARPASSGKREALQAPRAVPPPGARKSPPIRLDLPPDVARWFVAQIPQGGTADDLVRGFIVDAFNDEVGQ